MNNQTPETEIEKLTRLNSELRNELIRSSKKVVNLKASIVPAIKLINQSRWEILDLKRSLDLHKSRESNLLKKIKEMETVW